jgi:hypothetical protein
MFMLGIMFAFMIFITVVILIEPIKEQVTQARADLDCTNTAISTGQKMTCILVDSYLPIFIGIGIAIAIAYLGIKEYRSQQQ